MKLRSFLKAMEDAPTQRDGGGDASTMTLMEHLAELRSRVIKMALAVLVGAVAIYVFYERIYDFATDPYCKAVRNSRQKGCDLVFLGLTEGFTNRVRVSLYLGLVAAFPVILWQLWRFIAPGLYKRERRYAILFVGSSTLLFAMGAALAYISLPEMFKWLIEAAGPGRIENRADDYFRLLALMVAAFGISFEFPLVLLALQAVGLLHPNQLAGARRFAIVGIVIVVAVVTPGGDPVSLFALSIPLVIFYEVSIWIGRLIVRRRA